MAPPFAVSVSTHSVRAHAARILAILLLGLPVLLARPALSADWPSFRGNLQNTGVAPEALRLPLHPAWSYPTGGTSIISTAAVSDGVVYFGIRDTPGSTSGAGGSSKPQPVNRGALIALDERTGHLKWRFSQVQGVPLGWVDSSPTVSGKRIYFTCRDGYFYCVDTSGKLVWRYRTGGTDSSSPAIVDGLALFGSGYPNTSFYALDLADHTPRWQASTGMSDAKRPPNFVYSSPAVAKDQVVFGANNGVFTCLSRANGNLVWQFPTDGTIDFFAPAIADGRVFAAGGDYDPRFYAINASTGKESWHFQAPTSHNYLSSPAVAGGRVFEAMGTFQQQLFALDTATGHPSWSFPLGTESLQPFISSPVVSGSVVYIGSGPPKPEAAGGILYGLDVATGSVRFKLPVGAPIVASPSVADGRLFIGSMDGVMHALAGAGASGGARPAKPSRRRVLKRSARSSPTR